MNALVDVVSGSKDEALLLRGERPLQLALLVFAFLIFCFAVYFRVGDQASKPFWVDEVWRAQQILHTNDYFSLRRGEYFGMEAPVQLSEYILGKAGLAVLGKSEIAFRIWPLLFSLFSVVLFFVAARQLLSPLFAIVTLFCFAASPGLIEHAQEFKPYSFEVFLSLAAVVLAIKPKPWGRIRSCMLIAVFFIMLFLSNVGPFFLFLPVYLVPGNFYRRALKLPKGMYAAFAVVFVCFLIFYGDYVDGLRSSNTIRFWEPYYLHTKDGALNFFEHQVAQRFNWYVFPFGNVFNETLLSGILLSLVVLLIVPLVLFWQRSPFLPFYILPLLLQVVLSLGGVYPFMTRVSTFFYPLLLLGLGHVGDLILGRMARSSLIGTLGGLLTVGLLLGAPLKSSEGLNRHYEEVRPLLEVLEVLELRENEELLLLANYSAQLALRFYAPTLIERVALVDFNLRAACDESCIRAKLTAAVKDTERKVCVLQGRGAHGYSRLNAVVNELPKEISHAVARRGAYLLCFD